MIDNINSCSAHDGFGEGVVENVAKPVGANQVIVVRIWFEKEGIASPTIFCLETIVEDVFQGF